MLIYALSRDTNKLEHIDSVANGLKCNCFCSGCNDSLVAKNNCSSGRRNHFSHHSKDENRNCLMTQLHLAAQHHFLNAKYITLPEVSFLYKDKYLKRSAIGLKVLSAQLETKIEHYYADVTIETNIGMIVIEVCVTHKNELEKTAYYQQNKIASIEYDLGPYLSKDIDEAINDLDEYRVESTWLYEWCRDELIQEYEDFLKVENERIQKKRLRSAKDTANKFIQKKQIILPSLNKTFQCNINGRQYTSNESIFKRIEKEMTDVTEVTLTSTYLLLKGSLNNHTIWIAFLLKTDSIPTKILQLEGSVIVRTPAASENKKATWKWLKYPKLESRIPDKEKAFIEACQFREQLNNNVMRYLLSSDKLFKKDYSKWALWMKKNKLFEATPSQRNPKLPRCLVHHKELLCLWVFDSWYILTLSYLAEIIDSKPKGTMIYYCDIFDELSMRLPLHPNFSQLEQSLSSIVKTPEEKSTIIKEHIIEEALMPFRESAQVICLNGGFQRLENLLLSISFK